MSKTITNLAATLALSLLLAAGASAATYVPKPHAKCRAGYAAGTVVKRELKPRHHHHKLVWVAVKVRECVSEPIVPVITPPPSAPSVPVISTTTPSLTYQASLTSALTPSATIPLEVTYDYSADAILNGTDLGAEGQLPPGFLSISSTITPAGGIEEQLCSINVGTTGDTGDCTFGYAQPGTYAITIQYAPTGAAPVDVHYNVNVQPFGSPTTGPAT